MNQDEKKKVLEDIVRKVWADKKFKQDLLKNPVFTIKKHFDVDITIPEGKKLVVYDQTDGNTVYINIPNEPSIDSLELTETQLEQIAGGQKINFNQILSDQMIRNILTLIQ